MVEARKIEFPGATGAKLAARLAPHVVLPICLEGERPALRRVK